MSETKTFEARLGDGDTREVEARWCPKAQWYVARLDSGERLYFETGGEQV